MAAGLTPHGRPLQFEGDRPYVGVMDAKPGFALTDRAAQRIAEIVAAEGRSSALRVAVLAGGCSGFQYRFELDETPQHDDLRIEVD
jgi:iron-sulfur cluster insertion protein